MKRRHARLVCGVALALVAGACNGPAGELPPPPTTAPTTSTTAPTDLSLLDLHGVPGSTTTTVALGPGHARLFGVVSGPDGAVAGARVRIERLVGDAVAGADVGTDAAGHWEVKDVRGGRYRVRAWLAPELSITTPAAVFVGATEQREVPLTLQRYQGLVAVAAVAPSPPIVDEPVDLAVHVARRTVDEQGVVRSSAVPNTRLELFTASGWEVRSTNPTFSDSVGRGDWELQCDTVGKHPLSVVVGTEATVPVEAEACALTPPPPSTTSTTGGGSSTSTSRPRTTTTTSRGPRRTTTTAP